MGESIFEGLQLWRDNCPTTDVSDINITESSYHSRDGDVTLEKIQREMVDII